MQYSESCFKGKIMKHKIIIVEDHPIVRKGFIMLINQENDMNVVGEADGVRSAIQLINTTQADLMLIDLSLHDGNGIELIKNVKNLRPELPVLVVSLHEENVYAERAIRAGAGGYIMKSEATENILTAIREVLNGNLYVSDTMKAYFLNKLTGSGMSSSSFTDALSDRELEVFQCIGDGKKTKEIAALLNLSVKTVETYKAHIKTKMGIKDSTDLIRRAVEWKVLDS